MAQPRKTDGVADVEPLCYLVQSCGLAVIDDYVLLTNVRRIMYKSKRGAFGREIKDNEHNSS